MFSLSRECWKQSKTFERAARATPFFTSSTTTSSLVSLFSTSTSSSKPRVLRVASFGDSLVPYNDALLLQEAIAEARRRGHLTADVALSLHHSSVYTLGKRANALSDLRSSPEAQRLLRGGKGDMESSLVVESPRGGQATWHGPGQAVLYPVLLLRGGSEQSKNDQEASRPATIGVRRYMEELESTLVTVSQGAGVEGCVSGSAFGSPGAWVGDEETTSMSTSSTSSSTSRVKKMRKIGAVGVRVSRGVATHGAALNVHPDLRAFEAIVPCGDEEAEPTSIEAELMKRRKRGNVEKDGTLDSSPLDVSRIGLELAEELSRRLGYEGGTERIDVEELKRELREHGYKI